MTPNILPYLVEADRRRPDLKIINTAHSCFELLQLTLALAGPEWSFVGKTADMDGASVRPEGFVPFTMQLTRSDGAQQIVKIAGVSMDAAWHVPSHRQVKVIANSSANDDENPAIHGPARLQPYEIEPQHYRWHNPPVRQEKVPMANRPAPILIGEPPPRDEDGDAPRPSPPTPRTLDFPPRDLVGGFFTALDAKYALKGRGNRTGDPRDVLHVDNEGLFVWLSEFLRRYAVGDHAPLPQSHGMQPTPVERARAATVAVLNDIEAAWPKGNSDRREADMASLTPDEKRSLELTEDLGGVEEQRGTPQRRRRDRGGHA